MTRKRCILVTGFEPFGGFDDNPSAKIARHLDGKRIDGLPVVGRELPVDLAKIDTALAAVLKGLDPEAVILLGLAPGEACIRLERVALNLADFAIADNAGQRVADRPLDRSGGPALWSRLPLRAIQARLLKSGIPARLSETAGTYLCNAAMYRTLALLPKRVPCGFVHLPLLPAQVAAALSRDSTTANPASMAFSLQLRAVDLALRTTLAEKRRSRSPKA